jgi:hypothetical protein
MEVLSRKRSESSVADLGIFIENVERTKALKPAYFLFDISFDIGTHGRVTSQV